MLDPTCGKNCPKKGLACGETSKEKQKSWKAKARSAFLKTKRKSPI